MTLVSRELLHDITQSIKLSGMLKPENLSTEREKFLNNPTHNPKLRYPEFSHKIAWEQLERLNNLEEVEGDDLQSWHLNRKLAELRLELQLLLARGSESFGELSCQLYQCHFRHEDVLSAEKDAASDSTFEVREHRRPHEVVQGIHEYLQQYGVHDWEVRLVTETDFYFRVRGQQKLIMVSERFNWDFTDFDTMLAHEIDGHVLRAVNAQQQLNPLLQKPFPFYIKTEEGLATFLADYCSSTNSLSRKHHALKYLAGRVAQRGDFLDTFTFLVDHGFTPDLAFQRTFRLKRGFEDTGTPGCFGKEAMYYEGMCEVKRYIDHGGSVEKLYAGKFGLADLQFAEIPTQLHIPTRLQKYLEERKP